MRFAVIRSNPPDLKSGLWPVRLGTGPRASRGDVSLKGRQPEPQHARPNVSPPYAPTPPIREPSAQTSRDEAAGGRSWWLVVRQTPAP
jgi:hypothetical protein